MSGVFAYVVFRLFPPPLTDDILVNAYCSEANLWLLSTNFTATMKERDIREIMDTLRSRQKRWLGHILRHDSLLRITLEGQIQEKKAYGRPRTMLLDWLLKTEEGNISYEELKMSAQDTSRWSQWRCKLPYGRTLQREWKKICAMLYNEIARKLFRPQCEMRTKRAVPEQLRMIWCWRLTMLLSIPLQKWNSPQGGHVHYTDAVAALRGIKWPRVVFSCLVLVKFK